MLLYLSWKPDEVVDQSKGFVLLKVKYYGTYATGALLSTVEGSDRKDFDASKESKHQKGVFVNGRGKLSFE